MNATPEAPTTELPLIPEGVVSALRDAGVLSLHDLVDAADAAAPGCGCSDTECRYSLLWYLTKSTDTTGPVDLSAFSAAGNRALMRQGNKVRKAWAKFVSELATHENRRKRKVSL
jgi:hypothetical protein